jgi:hypothetical protein
MSQSEQQKQHELRKRIEELHEQSPAGHDLKELRAALGQIRDRESVMRIATEVLGDARVEEDGVVRVGDVRLAFDSNDRLSSLSTAGDVVIRETKSK